MNGSTGAGPSVIARGGNSRPQGGTVLTSKDRSHPACDHDHRNSKEGYDRRENQQGTHQHEDTG